MSCKSKILIGRCNKNQSLASSSIQYPKKKFGTILDRFGDPILAPKSVKIGSARQPKIELILEPFFGVRVSCAAGYAGPALKA